MHIHYFKLVSDLNLIGSFTAECYVVTVNCDETATEVSLYTTNVCCIEKMHFTSICCNKHATMHGNCKLHYVYVWHSPELSRHPETN